MTPDQQIADGWHEMDHRGNVIAATPLDGDGLKRAKRAVKVYRGVYVDYIGFDGENILGRQWGPPRTPRNRKTTAGKTPMALLPLDVLEGVAKVLDHGKSKYPGIDNWREPLPQGDTVHHYISAAFRHLAACQLDRAAADKDSGLSHLDHAITSLIIATHHVKKGTK